MDYLAAIKTFVQAADLGSLTKAAQGLSIKTSTASRHVQDLEADLRIALFNRSTRGLALTEGGKVFYARVVTILAQLDEAREATAALNLKPSGILRVTLPMAFGRRHVMPYMAEFASRYTDIDVDLIFSDDKLNLIESRIDLGIRIGALEDSSLMARRLAPHRSIVCTTDAYMTSHGAPATPAALPQWDCLLYSRANAAHWYVKARGDAAAEWQKVAVRGRLTASDSGALLDAVLAGMGIALLPTWLTTDAVRDGRLRVLFPEWEASHTREDTSIWAIYPPKKTVSSKVRSFIDFLAEKFGDLPYWDN